jgi:pilus assembly protein Flp/PilA
MLAVLHYAVSVVRHHLVDVDEYGASLVEYALLVALIAIVCIAAIAFVGTSASSKFSTVGSNLT